MWYNVDKENEMKVIYHKRTEVIIVEKDGREIYLVREGLGEQWELTKAYEFNALIPDSLDLDDPIIDEIIEELYGRKVVKTNGNVVVPKRRGRRTKAQILADQQRMLQEA